MKRFDPKNASAYVGTPVSSSHPGNRLSSSEVSLRKYQKVSLSDLYSNLPPEAAAESVTRILGFFRAYCGQGQSDGTPHPRRP